MSPRAEIRSDVEDPELIAAAVRPDNTPEVETRIEDGEIVTHIERETTGGLRSTIDDYVVNVSVAQQIHDLPNYE